MEHYFGYWMEEAAVAATDRVTRSALVRRTRVPATLDPERPTLPVVYPPRYPYGLRPGVWGPGMRPVLAPRAFRR